MTPRKKLASVPPPPPHPTSIYRYDFLWGWWWWRVVPWILSEMAPHNENFCEIFVPAAEPFLVTKHKFKLQQFEFMRLVISKKSLQSSRSTLFASQMFPYDRLFDLLRGLDTIRKIVREPGLGFSSVEMTGGH